ncbi:hypothetical protein [Mycolicibacterium sp. P1-5]|uniref:hypothetical protein n=1 Tax=Mycolicibacterium sp. P1-5 TaxID=2024617 RepID=UPI0011EC6D5F|nr:hypothetical protein [Mycolicibacterium sp. P1-5]
MATTSRRRRDPDARRWELCDSAIELLGVGGARELSHPKVEHAQRLAQIASTELRAKYAGVQGHRFPGAASGDLSGGRAVEGHIT